MILHSKALNRISMYAEAGQIKKTGVSQCLFMINKRLQNSPGIHVHVSVTDVISRKSSRKPVACFIVAFFCFLIHFTLA